MEKFGSCNGVIGYEFGPFGFGQPVLRKGIIEVDVLTPIM
jgi:hypothetical protein